MFVFLLFFCRFMISLWYLYDIFIILYYMILFYFYFALFIVCWFLEHPLKRTLGITGYGFLG